MPKSHSSGGGGRSGKDGSGNAAAIAALSERDGISGRFFQGAMKSSKRPSTKLQGKTKSRAPKAVSDCVPQLKLEHWSLDAWRLELSFCISSLARILLWRLNYG